METIEQVETGKDPIDVFIEGLQRKEQENDKSDDKPDEPEGGEQLPAGEVEELKSDEQSEGEESPVIEEPVKAEEKPAELTPEQQIEIFNKLTGLQIDSIDKVKEYSGILTKWPEYQKHLELYPTLVDKLRKSNDIMNFFPDEQTYKVAQLTKDEKYKGKEAELTKVMRSDISQMDDMNLVKLYGGLNAPSKVKDAFRYILKREGINTKDAYDESGKFDFEELDDEDKDLFYGLAERAKKELSVIGREIEVPKSLPDDINALLQQEADSIKDDLEKIRVEIVPKISQVIEGIKEIPVDDEFNFKFDLSADEKNDYSEFLTQAVLSGEFNVNTDEGRQDLKKALIDEIRLDNWDKIMKARDTYLKGKYEKAFREKYNNEKQLDKETPKPKREKTDASPLVSAIDEMIYERK